MLSGGSFFYALISLFQFLAEINTKPELGIWYKNVKCFNKID